MTAPVTPQPTGDPPAVPLPASSGPPSGPATLPAAATPYHHFLRTPRHRWWKALLLLVTMVAAYAVLSVLTTGIALAVDLVNGRNTGLLSGQIEMTPALFLGTNVGLALMIPAGMALQWAFYRQRPRWLSSVQGGFRWGLLGRYALVLVPIYLLYIGGVTLWTGLPTGPVNPQAVVYLVIVVLTTPLQCAGEEYAVRGVATRAIAAWIPAPMVALVVSSVLSALLFTAGHPNLTPWRLAGYLAIALGWSVLVWRTGGLEASVLAHVLNNVLVITMTALWGDMTQALAGTAGDAGPLDAALLVLVAVLSVAGVELVFRRSRYARVAQAG